MFWSVNRTAIQDAVTQASAVGRSHAMMELSVDGNIMAANAKFLEAMGYSLDEVLGKNHSMIVAPAYRDSPNYREFWSQLVSGHVQSGEFKRVGRGMRSVWMQGAYIPVTARDGKTVKVVNVSTDITEQKRRSAEDAAKVTSFERSQAFIEFDLDGTIISANSNFLNIFGYSLKEIQGKHHSILVTPAEKEDASYLAFWASLNRGEFQAAEYKRLGKGGKEIWILATYNPILDESGRPVRVVKIASDVTEEKMTTANLSAQISAIGKSQAVIEFSMDGIVLCANENFLKVIGYSLPEIKGKHHSIFVNAAERDSEEYRNFWATLRHGDYQSAEYRRVGKGGKEVWIQASYNPIFDLNGKPCKVIKYATDTTTQVLARMKSERVRSMMETVAAGAEELNASVKEISEAMVKSRNTAISAVTKVDAADSEAKRLSTAAKAMSGIIEIIGNITSQINLLALNATIESARAGEAGRGFAVVAAEVKSLADQAKQATDKIAGEIGGLNGISGDVILALNEIKREIQNVSEYVTATAAAVEEQSTVTNEMSSSMQRAAAEAASF